MMAPPLIRINEATMTLESGEIVTLTREECEALERLLNEDTEVPAERSGS